MILNRKIGYFFALIALLFLTLSNFLKVSPIISLLLIISYLLYLFFWDKRFFLGYGYIIFYILTNIVGVFLIETNDLFLSELNIRSENHNSLLLLSVAHMLFIEAIRFLYLKNNQSFIYKSTKTIQFFNFEVTKKKVLAISLIIISLTFTIMFLMVIDKPYFRVKLDRFLYKEKYLTDLSDKISNLSLYFSVFIGMYFLHAKNKNAIPLVFLIFIYLFWIGHKFSSFIVIAFIMALPFIYSVTKEKLNRILTGGFILISILVLIVSMQSFVVYKRDFKENNMYFMARLAQQGQLWWATYGLDESHKTHFKEVKDETKTYFKVNVPEETLYNSGIYKIMKLTTPEEIFEQKIYVKKSRYAYSTQATIFYYFNTVGLLIFSLLSGFLYYFITRKLLYHIANFDILPALLYTRLFVILNRVLMQSDFNKLFSYEVITIICILSFYSYFQKKENKFISF
jgi:hypothetical protein